jgi:hypothetical protein
LGAWAASFFEASRLHTFWTHYTRYDSSGRVISPSQRPLPDITQHSQETDIHALGGIRTHNPSKRAAADPRLRPRGHCDRHGIALPLLFRLLVLNLYCSWVLEHILAPISKIDKLGELLNISNAFRNYKTKEMEFNIYFNFTVKLRNEKLR